MGSEVIIQLDKCNQPGEGLGVPQRGCNVRHEMVLCLHAVLLLWVFVNKPGFQTNLWDANCLLPKNNSFITPSRLHSMHLFSKDFTYCTASV
jgi:hypothetical protein